MDYRYEEFKGEATPDGFNYRVDVRYGTIFLGTLLVKPDGYTISLIDTPKGKFKVNQSPRNKFKTKEIAAQVLHRTWKMYRSGGDTYGGISEPVPDNPVGVTEISSNVNAIVPSPKMMDDSVLMIPDYENEGDKYPGNLQPGYYNKSQLAKLLFKNKNDVAALKFIADMLEVGNAEDDQFVNSLRRVLRNPKALNQFISAIQNIS